MHAGIKLPALFLGFCLAGISFGRQDDNSGITAMAKPKGAAAATQIHLFTFDNGGGLVHSNEWRNYSSLGMGMPPGVVSNDKFLHRGGFFFAITGEALYVVEGTVTYYARNLQVPQVTVKLLTNGSVLDSTTTDAQGKFRFEGVSLPAQLVATKSGGFNRLTAITNADANRISFFLDDSTGNPLTPAEKIASDVDSSQSITVQDSVLISDFAFGRTTTNIKNNAGKWRILTQDLKHDTLVINANGSTTGLAFTAILLGDNNGSWQHASKTAETDSAGLLSSLPPYFALYPNYPNPFNAATIIRFNIPSSGEEYVKLIIFDLHGRRVRTLREAPFQPGQYEVEWDGRDDRGNPMASGVYIYRFQTAGFVQARKLVMLK